MLKKQQKKDLVKKLAGELKKAKAMVFSDYQGLAARDVQELRTQLRRENVRHKVVKLTLLKRALKQSGLNVSEFNFQVPLAASWSEAEELAAAKILQTFAKKNNKLKIIAGVLDGQLIDAAKVRQLAGLPSKQELLSQLVGVIAGPLRGLQSVLIGNVRGLLNVLRAKAKT